MCMFHLQIHQDVYLTYVHYSRCILHFNKKFFKKAGKKDGVDDDNFIGELFPNLGFPGNFGGEKNDVLVEPLESFSRREM